MHLPNQVESVPLEEIRKASLLTEKLLCDKLDWVGGIEAAKACQVKVQQTTQYLEWYTNSNVQEIFDKHLVAPSIDLYTCQIAIWRALWMIVGNKKLIRGIL